MPQGKESRELSRVKDDFLKLTVHELRRPLALLYGHYSMIEDGSYAPVPDAMRAGLKQIGIAMHDMNELVDGLAEVIAIEDGAAALRREPSSLSSLLNEAVASVRDMAAAQDTNIDLQIPELEVIAQIDRSRLLIAVINLLNNAIKYSPKGATVTVDLKSDVRQIEIIVSDQGEGINPAEASQVFEAWQHTPAPGAQGLGLGLYISKQIVKLHGGQLTLKNNPGQGAKFAIELPR